MMSLALQSQLDSAVRSAAIQCGSALLGLLEGTGTGSASKGHFNAHIRQSFIPVSSSIIILSSENTGTLRGGSSWCPPC